MGKWLKIAVSGLGLMLVLGAILAITNVALLNQWAPLLTEDPDKPQERHEEPANTDSPDTAQKPVENNASGIMSCSGISLNISRQASGFTLSQSGGDTGVGEVIITYFYANSGPEQATATIDSARETVTLTPTDPDSVTNIQADPSCESAEGDTWQKQ